MSKASILELQGQRFEDPMRDLIELNRFMEEPDFLLRGYCMKSEVECSIFDRFLRSLKGEEIEVTGQNRGDLVKLCEEFGFPRLEWRLIGYERRSNESSHPVEVKKLERAVRTQDRRISALEDEIRDLRLNIEIIRRRETEG